jgi:hypothetical protein
VNRCVIVFSVFGTLQHVAMASKDHEISLHIAPFKGGYLAFQRLTDPSIEKNDCRSSSQTTEE